MIKPGVLCDLVPLWIRFALAHLSCSGFERKFTSLNIFILSVQSPMAQKQSHQKIKDPWILTVRALLPGIWVVTYSKVFPSRYQSWHALSYFLWFVFVIIVDWFPHHS